MLSLHIGAATRDFQQCGMFDQQRLRPACAFAQSDQSLCWPFKYLMTVKLQTEHHLEFLSFKDGSTGSSESTLVKMPHCWKSHVAGSFKPSPCWTQIYPDQLTSQCFSFCLYIHATPWNLASYLDKKSGGVSLKTNISMIKVMVNTCKVKNHLLL